MKQVALFLDDPNPIHFDAGAVRRLGLGDKPINQGPNGIGYLLNLLIAFCGAPEGVRRLQCRLHANVFAGDKLRAGGRVLDVSEEGVTCEVWLKRGQDLILSGTAAVTMSGAGGGVS
jgi:acyl dehydratase